MKYWTCFVIGWTGGILMSTTAYQYGWWAFVPAAIAVIAYMAVRLFMPDDWGRQ